MAILACALAHLWWTQKLLRKDNTIETKEVERMRSSIDRRSGADRRKAHDLDYFLNNGIERRRGKERRSPVEQRRTWLRVGEWHSVCLSLIRRRIATR